MELSSENKLILASFRINPSIEDLEKINELIPTITDWEHLTSNIIDRGIAPLLYKKLPRLSNRNLVPDETVKKLSKAYYLTLTRSMMLYEAFVNVVAVCSANGIPVIALKGIHLSEKLYGDIGLRQMSDIDILVKPEDAKETLQLLELSGYKCIIPIDEQIESCDENLIHFSPMVLKGVSVEVHIRLLNNERIQHSFFPDKIWENSEFTLLSNQPARVLQLHDLLIHVSLHLHKHMLGGTMQFTGWIDITNLLEKYTELENWHTLRERCNLFSCGDEVFRLIVLAKEYMNANVPDDIYNENKHLLKNDYRKLFIKYLKGYKGYYNQDQSHLNTLIRIKPFKRKISYLYNIIVPPKLYMIYKYKIESPTLVLLFYPYRWWLGLRELIQLIVQRK